MKSMKNIVGVVVLFLFALLTVSVYKYIESQGPAQQIIRYQKEEEELDHAIGKLYYDKERNFPKTDINPEDLARIEENVNRYSEKVGQDNIIQFDYRHYQKKVGAQEFVNGLYTQPQILGDEIQAQSSLKTDLDYNLVKEGYRKFYFKHGQDNYDNEINRLLSYAKQEQDAINRAYQEIKDLEHIPIEPQYSHIIVLAIKDINDSKKTIIEPSYFDAYTRDADNILAEVVKKIKKWNNEDQNRIVHESSYLKDHIEIIDGGIP